MRNGFAPIILIIFALIILAMGGGFLYLSLRHAPPLSACTMEAKQCPDGTYVGRVGPNCEFAPCPKPTSETKCKSDSDCPSDNYVCEATEGRGFVYPNGSGSSTYEIIKGVCKLKDGGNCENDVDCEAGLICHQNSCTNPRGQSCNGPTDTSCPSGYQCIQGCGPPVSRIGEPPPPYFCELNEIANKPRNCPICLASNTKIATPEGDINVKDIKAGMRVWSLNKNGEKISSIVLQTVHAPSPKTHQMIHLVLGDSREVWASPDHPTANGIPIKELRTGNYYDGAMIEKAELVPYWNNETYDILPDSDTGYYWANGILLGSTLK